MASTQRISEPHPAPRAPSATAYSTREGLDAATAAAATCFASARWQDAGVRIDVLRGSARRLRATGRELVAICRAETRLSSTRLSGELERTARQLEAFADVVAAGDYVEAIIDPRDPDARPIPRPDVRRILVPVGPVAVFGAGNFPLAFGAAGGDTASALAAGCPVVVKGHPLHPQTNAAVARTVAAALAEAGAPTGAFALLQSDDLRLAEALVDAAEIAAVAFTGSLGAGRAIYDRAARRPKPIPVFAEMGSVNPVIVTEAALAARSETIADELVAAVTGSAGQLCTKPGVVLVPAGDLGDRFAAAVAEALEGFAPAAMLSAALAHRFAAGMAALGSVEGVTSLVAPTQPHQGGAVADASRQSAAAVMVSTDALAVHPELLDEHFGPGIVLVRWASLGNLHDAIGHLDGQLTATMHCEPHDATAVDDLLRLLAPRVGRLVFRGFATGVAVCHAMHHGGPYPATTAPAYTSVGMTAITRFLRPIAYQDAPAHALPAVLRDANESGIWRRVNGELTREPVTST